MKRFNLLPSLWLWFAAFGDGDVFESRRIRIDPRIRHECSSACTHFDRGEA